MAHPIRTARTWWQTILGLACVLDDIQATVRSRRTTKAANKALADTPRTRALKAARAGCRHVPACPPATAEDRQKAATVYADDVFTYLCNGLVTSTAERVPDFPPAGLATARRRGVEEVLQP
jgi:hypothetical protein